MNRHKCKFESKIIKAFEDIAAIKVVTKETQKDINGNLERFKTHVNHGVRWRIGILLLAATLIISLGGAIFKYGKLARSIEYHETLIVEVIKEEVKNGY